MTSLELDRILKLVPGYDSELTAKDCFFDYKEANRVIAFFETYLKHVKGKWADQPFLLQDWQKSIIANLFGWYRPDNTRRYREALIYVPRKNGKSLLAAGICNYMLFCDGEKGAEIYCAAAERDQAALVWDVAKQQIKRDERLDNACKVYQHAIVIQDIGSTFKAISADASTKHGYNAHCVVIDELHAQKNSELVDVLITSTGARTQPIICHITTSDYARPSICNQKHEYAKKIRDGLIEDTAFLPVIYEANVDDDWADPVVWAKANPNLGVSISLEYLQRECKRAIESIPYQNTFKRLHLNIKTRSDIQWIDVNTWTKCFMDFSAEDLLGCYCYAGLDLSSTTDLTSFTLFFPEEKKILSYSFAPKENALKRQKKDRVPYLAWEKEGFIEFTEGNAVDYEYLRQRINQLGEKYEIKEIAFDRWNSSGLATKLMGDGFEMVTFGQGYASMSAPSKSFEAMVLNSGINHNDNKLFNWAISNVMLEMDAAGNIKPSKKKSTERIDPAVALIMAIGRSEVAEAETESVYEERGISFV